MKELVDVLRLWEMTGLMVLRTVSYLCTRVRRRGIVAVGRRRKRPRRIAHHPSRYPSLPGLG